MNTTTAIVESVARGAKAASRLAARWKLTPALGAPRVALCGPIAAQCSPGGGEVQLRSLAEWLPQAGVNARPWRPWEDDWTRIDALHLVGSAPEFLPLAAAARRAGKPVILSPVTWFTCRDLWREPWPLAARAWACAKFAARAVWPAIPSWRRELYHAADLLLPNSEREAEQLQRYFNVPSTRLRVTPNGVDERFASANADLFLRATAWRDFVLCVGRVEPRKNQLTLIEALRGTGLPLVFIGAAAPGHEAYLQRCRAAARGQALFLGHVAHHNPLLASAYAACRALALVSWYETPGLAALEAGLTGAPLVLTADGACQEYFAEHAQYVRPFDRAAIRQAVLNACDAPRSAQLVAHVRERYASHAVAQATKEAYETLL